jgi:hypothetical protein
VGRGLVKSVIRTIRIDEDLNEALEKTALHDNTSVNFVVNNALREHIEWSSVITKIGFSIFPQSLMTKFFEKLTDKECVELGEIIARDHLKPFLEYRFGSVSFENWIRIAREFAKYIGGFKFLTERRKEGETLMIFEHGRGIKWSNIYKGITQYIAVSQGLNFRHELTDSKCTVTVSGPSLVRN